MKRPSRSARKPQKKLWVALCLGYRSVKTRFQTSSYRPFRDHISIWTNFKKITENAKNRDLTERSVRSWFLRKTQYSWNWSKSKYGHEIAYTSSFETAFPPIGSADTELLTAFFAASELVLKVVSWMYFDAGNPGPETRILIKCIKIPAERSVHL